MENLFLENIFDCSSEASCDDFASLHSTGNQSKRPKFRPPAGKPLVQTSVDLVFSTYTPWCGKLIIDWLWFIARRRERTRGWFWAHFWLAGNFFQFEQSNSFSVNSLEVCVKVQYAVRLYFNVVSHFATPSNIKLTTCLLEKNSNFVKS